MRSKLFRSVLAVFLGFVLMMILITANGILVVTVLTTLPINLSSFSIDLVLVTGESILALFGGYFTVSIAGDSRVGHAQVVAFILFVLGALNLPNVLPHDALWFALLRIFSISMCVYLGGHLRCRQYPPLVEEDGAND